RYRIDELLGSGGMGAVFKGHHIGLERDVAIKVLHPSLGRDHEISARFDREARSASRLDHPNCVSVTDYGSTEDEMKFMVMQLLEGNELGRMLGQPLPALRAIELVLQIVRALEHAHAQGVVHRDIKPENVFITRDHAGREVLKLVDFGIAKIMSADGGKRMTKVGLVFGTPAYMSPEQAAGIEADERADLYSVGILLYEMLAGKAPFDSPDPVALVRMQITADPPRLPAEVPPVLAACVERLLAKNRVERFQSAAEVREVLEGVQAMLRGDPTPSVELFPRPSEPVSLMPSTSSSQIADPTAGTGEASAAARTVAAGDSASAPITTHTMPPSSGVAKSSRAIVLAVGAGLLAAGALWIAFGREPVVTGGDASTTVAQPSAATRSDEAPGGAAAVAGPDDATLAEIDRLIQSGELEDADKLLVTQRELFPDQPQLSWRWGRLLAKRRNKKAQALVAYGDALEADPALLDDKQFYAELHDLLQIPALRDDGLDLALEHMGKYGHTFLLDLVNNEKKPLAYENRHRALEELATDSASWALVNRRLNIALDVLQAKQSITPCQAYDEALTNVAAMPDYYFVSRVERSEVPLPGANAKTGGEDPVLCATLPQRRADTLELLSALAPEGADAPADEPKVPAGKGGTASAAKKPAPKHKTTTKKASPRKVDCNKFRGIFKKQCW
ncbi:MAG TPA: serine/threonine-protein kinase, partial [Nannocystaceae bacterium]|nr:serine/threonine-protein kinase [Nannocystaceae bacterium]